MAPEQIVSGKDVDQRTDVYALGVILYEALAGTRAHQGEKAEVLYHAVYVDPRPLAELRSNLPQGLAAVVARAMARTQEERYSTMREFAAALRPFASAAVPSCQRDANATEARAEGFQALGTTTWDESTNGDSASGGSSSQPRASAASNPLVRRRRRLGILAALLAAAAAVGFERSKASPPNIVPVPPQPAELFKPSAPPAPGADPSARDPGLDASGSASSSTAPNPVGPSSAAAPSRSPARTSVRPAAAAQGSAMPSPGAMFDARNPYATP
jgi:serine/threonine-protein kinase